MLTSTSLADCVSTTVPSYELLRLAATAADCEMELLPQRPPHTHQLNLTTRTPPIFSLILRKL